MYKDPEIRIISFDEKNIITASGDDLTVHGTENLNIDNVTNTSYNTLFK